MGTWTTTVTNKGIALQTKQVRGAAITFTKVVAGSGSVSLVNLKEQTAVSNIKQTISVESIRVQDAAYTINVLLSNEKLTSSYNLSQIGFYATDPDEGEILFAISQIDTPKAIPTNADSPGYCLEFAFTFQNSNEATIEITPDMAAYMTRAGVDDVVETAKEEVTISGTETGNPITVYDSTDAPFSDITVYGASEQVSTTGKNILDVDENLSLDDVLGIDVNIPAGTYKVSIQNETHGGDNYPYIRFTDNNVWILLAVVRGEQVVELTQPETKVYLYTNGMNAAASKDVNATITKLMLSVDGGEYEPYTGGIPAPNPDYPQDIESVADGGNLRVATFGKNLIPYPYFQSSYTDCGVTFTAQADGGIEGSGTATGATGIQIYNGEVLGYGKVTVALSGNFTNMVLQIALYDKDENELVTYQGSTKITFDVDKYPTAKRLRILVKRGSNSVVSGVAYPQLEIGNTATDYELYTGATATVPLTEPLYGIPVSSGGNYTDADGQQWLCNEIDLARGVYIKRINTVDIGTLEWSYSDAYLVFTALVDDICPNTLKMLCTHYQISYRHDAGSPDMTIYGRKVGELGGLGVKNSNYTDAATFTSAMAGAICIYEMVEPVETQLTDEQISALHSLQTFESVTNIFADEPATMEVEYFKNTENGKTSSLLKEEIEKIKDGTTVVKKASSADSATKATQDSNGNAITESYHSLVVPTNVINDGDDLNNYKTIGEFRCISGTSAATLSNCPYTTSGFRLTVENMSYDGHIKQTLDGVLADGIWFRTSADKGVTWRSWKKVSNVEYEEGTWTPTLAVSGAVTSRAKCTYKKVGKIVHIQGYLYYSTAVSISSGSPIQLQGLPFTPEVSGSTTYGSMQRLPMSVNIGTTEGGVYSYNGSTSVMAICNVTSIQTVSINGYYFTNE